MEAMRTSNPRAATVDAEVVLRDMIMRGELAPGQQLRQEELSAQIGVSRTPLREVLRTLESEGLVRHSRNQGYFVAKLTRSELEQIYLMRRLLETELLRSLRRPAASDLDELRAFNSRLRVAAEKNIMATMLSSNREFHFALFAMSPLDLVLRQVKNLWQLSEAYRTTYLWMTGTRERVLAEHEEMIRALSEYDLDDLVRLSDSHRAASEAAVVHLVAK